MKKSFLLFFCMLLLANFLYAQPNLSGKKIYVNPGHGSYGHDDRPQSTIPYPILSGLGIPDTCGFFESNTNLHKCLYLGKKLEQYGAKVTYSHTECGPWPYEKENGTYPQYKFGVWQGNNIEKWNNWVVDSATWYRDFGTNDPFTYCKHPDIRKYNRIPALVGQEVGESFVNGYEYDCFISVHSNAPGDANDNMTNYPLFLYRGFDMENSKNSDESNNQTNENISYYSPGSYEMADAAWKHCYELIEGVGSLCHPYREEPSVDKKFISGDLDFYYTSEAYPDGLHVDQDTLEFAGKEYYSYLGVIRHMVPGFLAEGYYHTYGPARHQALNYDYCRMEGLAYFRGILDYFGLKGERVGYILGVIKDNNTPAPDHKDYRYHPGSHDQWMPCNGAVVTLKKGGQEVGTYTVDQNYNGIFAFFDLEPGVYTLESTVGELEFSEQVVVKANETTYSRLYPKTTPAICAYNLQVEEGTNSYTFSFDANSAATTAKIVFYNDSKQKLGEQIISVVKGKNEITIPTVNIPGKNGQSISWEVDLTGEAIAEFELLQSDASLDVYSTSQLFNAVNTNPMSENFGQIYVMHRANTNSSDLTQAKESGLYVYDFELTRQNNSAYKGGLTFGHPTRMSLDEEGYLYISDWSDPYSGIYIANTADLTQNFTQFFQGTRNNNNGIFTNNSKAVGASTTGNSIYGKGKDAKLYVFNEDQATGLPKNGITIYNIGQNDGTILRSWGTVPSATITCSGNISGNSSLWGTSRGVFMSQHRDGYGAYASILFYNTQGECVYSSPNSTNTTEAQSPIHGSYGGGFAVSPDENMLIINDGREKQQFLVFDITWNGTTPTLALRTTYKHGLGAIRQMNWDYAGNLVCSGDDGIHIFAVPTNNNNTIVPARQSFVRKDAEISSRRIWAYDLKRTLTQEGYLFSFTSTVDAIGAELILKDDNGNEIKTVELNNVTQGNNEFLLGYNEVPTTTEDISWEITLSAGEVAEQATLQELTSDMDKFYYYLAQDVKVNNNPYSDHFGKIYVLETYDGKNDGKSQHSKTQKAGIYVYDQNLNLENYAKGYLPEGVDVKTFTTGHQYRVLHRLAIDPLTNQVAFIQSKTDELWLADPNNLNKRADNILSGKSTYASSMCYSPDGTLYIFGYESTNAETKAIIYKKQPNSSNLEQLAEIDSWEYENERNSMAADGRGGLWVISQFSGNNYGNFFHVNQYGDVDFNVRTDGTTLSSKLFKDVIPLNMPVSFNRGQLAYDAERDILAIGGDSKVTLFEVTYNANGTPSLRYWIKTPSIGANIDGIAFDYAGDLYVMSATTERFYKFAVPTDNNTCTTPAPESQKLWANPLILDDTKDNTKLLEESMSKSRNVYVFRTMVPGMYNTLCLPFALNSLEGTCLEGAKVLKYSQSEEADGDILLYFDAVTTMEAGVPYLIEPQADIDVPMDFIGVRITETDEEIAGERDGNGISFNGILAPKTLEANDKSILFLVSGNRLAWANATANMNGMRAYFSLPEGEYDKLRTRARIVTSESTATDIQQTTTTSTNAQKLILNGMLYILKDGQLYTVFGTKVK